MAAAAEVQALLRFLTKDARIPLTEAMPKIHSLRKLNMNSPEKIAEASHADLKIVFPNDKLLKQVVNAAKRVSNPKKKPALSSRTPNQPSNTRTDADEAALALPTVEQNEADLQDIVIETNRAPLFLAFTLAVLNYTHPEQPISSKLSLAQAVVSTGAQSKAKAIGLTSGPTAEEDGWAMGQPKVRVMGREIAVMRKQMSDPTTTDDSQEAMKQEAGVSTSHEAFWGIDLDALRKSNGPLIAGKNTRGHNGPPIYTPQSARNYLLRSMNQASQTDDQSQPSKQKKLAAAEIAHRKEEAAAMVLKAIDVVLNSWNDILSPDELDRRAQSWYALVRPEVAQGPAGWGQRGQLQLHDILKLKRTP